MNKILYGILTVLMVVIVLQLGYLIFYKPTLFQSAPTPTLTPKTTQSSNKIFAKGVEKLEEIFTSSSVFVRSVDFEIGIKGEVASLEKNVLLLTKEKKQLPIELNEKTIYLETNKESKRPNFIQKEDLKPGDNVVVSLRIEPSNGKVTTSSVRRTEE